MSNEVSNGRIEWLRQDISAIHGKIDKMQRAIARIEERHSIRSRTSDKWWMILSRLIATAILAVGSSLAAVWMYVQNAISVN